eukprot:s469_g17.t1
MLQRVGFADEPEPETEAGAAAASMRRSFNKAAVSTEAAFEQSTAEPECESLLLPDPAEFVIAAALYEPHSPEHMAMWLISKLTDKITEAVQRGDAQNVLRGVEQRQVMVDSDENPERRTAVWCMMQTLDALSDSED